MSHRTITVLVRGQRVQVEDPGWCVSPHPEDLAFLEDLVHEGERIEVRVPTLRGAESALIAYVAQYPFARDEADREPYMAMSAVDDGDYAELRGATVDSVADDLVQHAARLRTLSSKHLPVATA